MWWVNGRLLQRGRDAFIFLTFAGRRRQAVFLLQCESQTGRSKKVSDKGRSEVRKQVSGKGDGICR